MDEQVITRFSLWSILSKTASISSLIPKWSVKIRTSRPCNMPMASSISRTSTSWSANTTSWINSIVSGVGASTGNLERSVNHFYSIEGDGAESQKNLAGSCLVWVIFFSVKITLIEQMKCILLYLRQNSRDCLGSVTIKQ